MYADALAATGREVDERIAALDLALHNAQTERDIAQREAADASAEVTRLDSALGAEQVARKAADARAATAEATRLTAEARVRELEQLLAGVPAGWKLAFEDTFDGAAVDLTKWNVRSDTQSNHLGKNQPANARQSGGLLGLWCERLATAISGKPYSTAYLDTNGKPGAVRYGRWEIRCTLPKAKGAWPAFWLRDAALLGEIDVMEAVLNGKGGGKIVFTVHQSTNGDQAKKGFTFTPPAGFDWAALHDFAVEWDGTTMTWFVDGKTAATTNVTQLPWLATSFGPAGMNIRLNYQAGGSMPNYYGLPMDATSVLPDVFTVDRVRVLTKA